MANEAKITAIISAEDKASATIKSVGDQVASTASKIGVGMAAVGAGITLLAKNATDFTVDLVSNTKKMQRETGLAAEEASSLIFVTNRLGIEATQASASFGIFSKNITEMARSATPADTALGKLGVRVQDTNGNIRNFNDILLETADQFKKMPDGPEKTAIALDLFGRSGKDMIKVLNLGSDGIRDLQKKADELGLTLNSSTIASVTKYIQAQKDLTDSSNALKVTIGTLTAPVLARFKNELNDIILKLLQSEGPMKNFIVNTLAFGGPLLTAAGGLVAFVANARNAGISITAIGVALRTFVTFITGPFGIAITAVTAAVGLLAWTFGKKKVSVDASTTSSKTAETVESELSTTMQQLAANTDRAKQAQDSLNNAQFDATGASLQVEAAQVRYNEAVRDYGPASLQARQASYDLESAKRRLQDANEKVAVAQQIQNQNEGAMVQATPTVVGAINMRAGAVGGITLNAQNAINKVAELDLSIRNADSAIGNLTRKTSSATPITFTVNRGAGVPLRGNAGGTDYWRGGMTWVGERGPEVVDLPQGSRVIPNHRVPSAGGGGAPIAININAGAFMGSDMQARKYALQIIQHMKEIAGARATTVQELLG